jgi:PleD family two-component response regulator
MTDLSNPAPPVQRHAILVVDDALDTLRMLCDALTAEGYAVLAARDAQEALERLEIVIPEASCWTRSCPAWTASSCAAH